MEAQYLGQKNKIAPQNVDVMFTSSNIVITSLPYKDD